MYQWWPIALLLQQLGQQRMTYCQICCAANKEWPIRSYAGLHSAQNRPDAGLASMPDLVVLDNADLHKLMRT